MRGAVLVCLTLASCVDDWWPERSSLPVLGGWGLAEPCQRKVDGVKPSPELEAVFRRFWEAAVAQDLNTALNYISADPHVRSIAVAEDEWWVGRDFVARMALKRVEEVGVANLDFHRLEGFEDGSHGWVAADLTFVTRDDARFRRRFTATYRLEEGVWRNVQWHASLGVPNVEAWGFELTKTLARLVDSLDSASAERIADSSVGGTVTVMFTDIEDSTQKSADIGDQAWLEIIDGHFAVLQRIAERWGGRLVKTLGDGAMMTFPSAGSGIDAAIAIQKGLGTSDLKVRVGIHTGDAMPRGNDYVGVTVAKAARIAAVAAGGEILASSVTAALTTNREHHFGPAREVQLKGLAGVHPLVPVMMITSD